LVSFVRFFTSEPVPMSFETVSLLSFRSSADVALASSSLALVSSSLVFASFLKLFSSTVASPSVALVT